MQSEVTGSNSVNVFLGLGMPGPQPRAQHPGRVERAAFLFLHTCDVVMDRKV